MSSCLDKAPASRACRVRSACGACLRAQAWPASLPRKAIVALGVEVVLAILVAPVRARAEGIVELGGFAGWHVFSDRNELGLTEDAPVDETLNDAVVLGPRVGFAWTDRLTLEAELALAPSSTKGAGADVLVVGWRAQALYHLAGAGTRWMRPFVLAGAGALTSSGADRGEFQADTDALFHAGAGVRYAVDGRWGLRVDVRALLPPSTESKLATVEVEAFAGVYATLGAPKREPAPTPPPDQDADGVPDVVDRCPTEPAGATAGGEVVEVPEGDASALAPTARSAARTDPGVAAADGRAGSVRVPGRAVSPGGAVQAGGGRAAGHSSRAQVPDDTASAVQAGGGRTAGHGCPEVSLDADGDGLGDAEEGCPSEPEDRDGRDDDDGCPDPDDDADGVHDTGDRCPTDPEDTDGFLDDDGCPELDDDRDDVPDAVDACPREPEAKNLYRDEDGCPDELPAALAAVLGPVEDIRFTGGARLTAKGRAALERLVGALSSEPSVAIEVRVFAPRLLDATRRAEAIRSYLAAKGVAEARFFILANPEGEPTDDRGSARPVEVRLRAP